MIGRFQLLEDDPRASGRLLESALRQSRRKCTGCWESLLELSISPLLATLGSRYRLARDSERGYGLTCNLIYNECLTKRLYTVWMGVRCTYLMLNNARYNFLLGVAQLQLHQEYNHTSDSKMTPCSSRSQSSANPKTTSRKNKTLLSHRHELSTKKSVDNTTISSLVVECASEIESRQVETQTNIAGTKAATTNCAFAFSNKAPLCNRARCADIWCATHTSNSSLMGLGGQFDKRSQ